LIPSSGTAGRRVSPRRRRHRAAVVEAEPVDERAIADQPEHARPRVAGLRLGGDRAELDEAEAERGQLGRVTRVLVEAGGQAERRRHLAAEDGHPQPRVTGRGQPPPQRLHPRWPHHRRQQRAADPVGGLGRQVPQHQPEHRPVEHRPLLPPRARPGATCTSPQGIC